jgi:hypothetical protein
MDEQQPPSPRARLQALLAIPERQRTDAEWDELNELEIMLASGNRQGAPDPRTRGNSPSTFGGGQQQHGHRGGGQQPGGGGGQNGPGGGQQHRGQRQGRRFHQRPPKRGPR